MKGYTNNTERMTKKDRKLAILSFMAGCEGWEKPIMSPTLAHTNLESQGATFSKTTTRRLMQELEGEGLLENIDETRGYYRITDRGLEVANNQ